MSSLNIMNCLHRNIRFTYTVDPERLTPNLSEQIKITIPQFIERKLNSPPIGHLQYHKRYKRNLINGYLSKGTKISLDFDKEKKVVFHKAHYTLHKKIFHTKKVQKVLSKLDYKQEN